MTARKNLIIDTDLHSDVEYVQLRYPVALKAY
jgi:hypothetical protein